MLLLILIILVTENVYLVQNEKLEAQFLDSTNFKNALAKELLKKKLLNLESARQQDSLAQFLKKGEKNPIRGRPNFNVDDDPSRKQAQMANSFIASSNLLFGTKSQRRACSAGNKPSNKETVLDIQSLRHSFSGYNEEGVEFPSSKDSGAAVRKRSFSKKGSQDPISCYLIEPKKVTCMHKDIIYKIQLPSSDVADDEIGRIVESIYRAVEVNRSSIGRGTIEDSSKRKRASDEYLKSLFLNNLIFGAHPKTALMPAYNGNNAIYLPLIIPVSQPKLEAAKPPLSYYPGLLIDPKLQLPYNLSVNGGVDASSGVSAIGKNVLIDNGFGGQYVLPESYFMQASNLRQRSDNNITTDEEKRRNWLALMATNGYVPVDRGINVKLANSAHSHIADSDQSLSDDKEALGSNRKLKIEETGEFLDKLLNKRQERDTYHLRRQLRKRPCNLANNNRPDYFDRVGEEKHQLISKITDNVGEIDVEGRGKGQQCPCPRPTCTTKCTTTCSPKCTTKCPPKCPTPCPTPCPLPCPTRCPCPKPGPPPCPVPCLPQYPTSCPTTCSTTCPTTCTTPCPTTCSTPCPTSCSTPYPTTCSTICPQHGPLSYPDFESGVISNTASKTSRQRQPIKSSSNVVMAQYENPLYPYNINAQSVIANQQQSPHLFLQSEGSNVGHQVNIISGKAVSHSSKELVLVANSSVAMDLKAKKPKDSFFSRLRSKFHKGILTNGTGTLNSSSNNQVQNKFRPPIVRFDQGPTGQVWHVSHELSVSANQMRHQPNTSSATPQQTMPAQSNQTRSVIHYNQPNQPNQPVIPLTPLQPTTPQPQITVNQTPPSGYQPPGSQSMPSGQPQQPTLPSGYQPQSPGNQTQPSMNQTQPGNQAPPPVGQSLPSGSQPLPSGSGPQSPGNNQCQPPNGGMTQPTTTTQATTNVQPTTTQCQTKQTTCTIRYQTTLPTSQPPNLANSGKTSNHQNHTNMGPPAPGRKVCQPLESQLHVPFQTLYFPKSQQQAKPLQARTNQFTGQIQQRPQAGRFPEPEWQQPPNEEIPLWKPPKPYQAPILTQGQSFYQPYANPQMYPNQVVHTTHLRIQPNIPSPSLAEQPITINQNVVHRIENPYQNVSRLPRTSFKWGKRHKALGINSEIPKIQGIEGARKVKWPLSPTSIYEKIARVRRYLKSRVKRRGLP